jgi:hypothetical protein
MVLETILIVGGLIVLGGGWAWSTAYKKKWRKKMEQKYPPTDSDGYSKLRGSSKRKRRS